MTYRDRLNDYVNKQLSWKDMPSERITPTQLLEAVAACYPELKFTDAQFARLSTFCRDARSEGCIVDAITLSNALDVDELLDFIQEYLSQYAGTIPCSNGDDFWSGVEPKRNEGM